MKKKKKKPHLKKLFQRKVSILNAINYRQKIYRKNDITYHI